MSISIQTNVTSLFAQENLQVNTNFQAQTIQRLTSGFRINSSGDDAAGLAVANGFRSDVAELNQGVRNANDGASTLQIIDGGLNNIAQILDRLKTLATESGSATFSGDRTTLNNEYQTLLSEITRQAQNIGLSSGPVGGRFNTSLSVYIGGGSGVQANAQIQINLSGNSNRVDAASLGLASSSIVGGGNNDISGAAIDLRSGTFLANSTQAFVFNIGGSSFTATVGNGGSAITGQQAVDQLNTQIAALGITASIDTTNGQLSFAGGSTAFNVTAQAVSGAGGAVATATGTAQNTANYISNGLTGAGYVAPTTTVETLVFGVNGNNTTVTLAKGTTLSNAINQLNTALNSQGVYAVKNTAGDGVDFQSANAFTVNETVGTAAEGIYNATGAQTVTPPVAGATATGNALQAIASIQAAVATLGQVQGKVGTGENDLRFAISLAESQITNFSAAESRIRDADIASEAANLTKAQTLQQTSIAALAQANAAPAAVLKLLQ